MWLTRLSITRPVTILMLVLALVVLGLQSRSKIPVELYPKIDIPIVVVSTIYPGTGPEEMETLVTKPIEDSISAIAGLDKLTSTSSEGVSTITMQLKLGTNIDVAAGDIRSKIDALRNTLPTDAQAPVVIKADFGAIPVIQLSLTSPRRESREIRRLADDIVKDRLGQIPGVAAVAVTGGDIREVQVNVDKARLEAYGLNILQVVNALKAENLNFPAGSIDEARQTSSVRVVGEFTDPVQIRAVRLASATNPNLSIGDVAEVKDTVAKPETLTRVDGGSSVTIAVQKQSDANTVEVADGIRAEMERLTGKPYTDAGIARVKHHQPLLPAGTSAVLPADLDAKVAMDQSIFVKDTLSDVYQSLFEGALLAVLIVFLFLHSLRGTIIVALAIPTSIIATFTVMSALGFTMNMMSMMALSLSVGILVDDSIVVLENIHRHLKMGKTPKQAAIDGRSEIGQAAMAITMVDVVVFVPIAFMGGIVGQMFRQFGMVVATATLFSLFISFTLTPMLASRWLKAHDKEEEDEAREAEHPGLFTRFTRAWETGYTAVDHFYRFLLNWALHHHSTIICLGLMTMLGSFAIAMPKPSLSVFAQAAPALVIGWLLLAGLWSLVRLATRRWARILIGLAAFVGTLLILGGIIGKGLAPIGGSYTAFLAVTFIIGTLAIIGYMLHEAQQGTERVSSPAPALVVGAVALFLAAFSIHGHFGFEFAPSVDQRQYTIKVEREVGTSLASTDKTVAQIEQALFDKNQYPETKTVFATVGGTTSSIFTGSSAAADTAQLSVELKDRTGSPIDRILGRLKEDVGNRSTDGVVRAINDQFAGVPGAKITATIAAGFGGSEAPIQIEVSGQQMGRIQQVANQILAAVQKTPGTYSCDLSWREGRPEMQAHIDRDRAAQYGVSVAQIATALRTSLQGDTTVKYRENGREYDIRVQLPEHQRNATGQLPDMVVATTAGGRPVYLYEVVKLEPAAGPTKLDRTDRQRTITVTGQIAQGYTLGVLQGQINGALAKLDQSGVNIVWAGQAQRMKESGNDLFGALLLSVLLVFMLMAALFESLLSPLIIMMAVPQAMAGAMFALTLTDKTLSIVTMIGIIMLVGLVTKNAILLVDFTNTMKHEHGKSTRDALLQAGPTRLHPILMTTLAMIFGMSPTALALAKGSEMRQPMAIAVIGGLMLSLFLTLLMVPVFYEIFDNGAQWLTGVKDRVVRMFGN